MGRTVGRYCRTCGATAPPEGRFCASCGVALNLLSPYPSPPSPSSSAAPPLQGPVVLQASVVAPTVGGSVRMGFGIALGMVLFFIALGAVVLLVIGLLTSTITWPFAQQGMRFEGVGPSDSVPVALEGAYEVNWTAAPTSPSACFLKASLRSPTDPGVDVVLANSPVEMVPAAAGARTVSVPSGQYVVHTESGCRWSIRLAHP